MIGKTLPKLTGEQNSILYLENQKNQVILGAAGSGKSLVATYRALRMEEQNPSKRILLLTMNREIKDQIKQSIKAERPNSQIRVYTMYSYCQDLMYHYYPNRELRFASVTPQENMQAIIKAINSVKAKLPNETLWNKLSDGNSFFTNEITWMQENGILVNESGRELYSKISRVGRGSERISSQQRKIMYEVYIKYYEFRRNIAPKKFFGFTDIYSFIPFLSIPDNIKPDFIIIDEVQDFTPIMFRALNSIIADNGYWCVFGDISQNIFGQRISWSSLGLENIRKHTLSKNYRNSYEIGLLAEKMLETGYFENRSRDFIAPIPLPENKFGLPKMKRFNGDFSEIIATIESNLNKRSTSIMTMDYRELAQIKKQLMYRDIKFTDNIENYTGPEMVYLQTINRVKGLEFDNVIIYCLDSANFRDNSEIIDTDKKILKPELMVDEDKAIVAKRIYVAVTRARKNLLMYYKNSMLDFLFVDKNLFEQG